MDVIYYYCYLFYKKVLRDSEPNMLTILVISAAYSFPISIIIEIIVIKNYCISLPAWQMFLTTPFFVFVNYLSFYRNDRYKNILRKEPKFFGSNSLSIIITVLFFLIAFSFVFWGPIYTKNQLDTCCGK